MYENNQDIADRAPDVVERLNLSPENGEVLRGYGDNLLKSSRRMDESRLWMTFKRPGSMCDEHLMQYGLSGIEQKD